MLLRFNGPLLALIGVLLASPALCAESSSLAEYDVKAAFLLNFARFVDWPSEALQKPGESFVIGILGKDPFSKDIEEQFSSQIVQEKKLLFKHLAGPEEAVDCQVVYISASEADFLGPILDRLRGQPVLTVSDVPGFVQRGGMVGFTMERSRVRFSINLAPAEKAGLKISSQLLKLAKTVKGKPHAQVH